MKKTKEELQQDHLKHLYSNISEISSLLSPYPSLVQPKFIIEHFKEQKVNSVLCYQYASFIRDCYGHINKSKTNSFTRSIMGKKNKSFDVPYSFGDYLCVKKLKMYNIIKQGFFDMEKINKSYSFSINQKFHVGLFDPEDRSRTKANIRYEQMVSKRKKNRSKNDIPEDEIFAFAINQFYIKTFGWQAGIILSQILYWILKNKRETIFFSDSELSRRIYLDAKTIKNCKIWNQDFINKEPSGNKFLIRVDLDMLVSFIKGTQKR
jgi:hypothetical protein